jgi:hypothetical protein
MPVSYAFAIRQSSILRFVCPTRVTPNGTEARPRQACDVVQRLLSDDHACTS